MAARLPRRALTLAPVAFGALAVLALLAVLSCPARAFAAADGAVRADPGGAPLARYRFEPDEALDSGPDTFTVFQPLHGDVSLSAAFRFDGARSVRLCDRPGDRDFPELQGHFPVRREGVLSIRFAFLAPDPKAPWHVALAGPSGFIPGKDGIAFWLRAEDGVLRHVTDGIPKRLLALRGFAWYVVAVHYDVAAGTYDLAITEEGSREPVVALTAQANVASAKESAVGTFSFVGDVLADARPSELFVDDIALTADPASSLAPFVAKGRRALFVDEWWRAARAARACTGCDDAEHAFAETLAEERYEAAERDARGRADATTTLTGPHAPAGDRARWLERAGDAAYFAGAPARAVRHYTAATEADPARTWAWLKRADMHHLLGEVDAERDCRERIYGALRDGPSSPGPR